MLIERDQEHEKDVIELQRRLKTEIKMQSKSQERSGFLTHARLGSEIPGFESNCSFIYQPSTFEDLFASKLKSSAKL